jgi:hypothetical protein
VLGAAKENAMMNGMGSMGWGMGLLGLLILILLVLGIAALVKYLMSGPK